MNIVYLHAHDAGRYIEPYGYAVPTPNLMNLARESTLSSGPYRLTARVKQAKANRKRTLDSTGQEISFEAVSGSAPRRRRPR